MLRFSEQVSFSCYVLTTGNKSSVVLSTADKRILDGIITFVDLFQKYCILDLSPDRQNQMVSSIL